MAKPINDHDESTLQDARGFMRKQARELEALAVEFQKLATRLRKTGEHRKAQALFREGADDAASCVPAGCMVATIEEAAGEFQRLATELRRDARATEATLQRALAGCRARQAAYDRADARKLAKERAAAAAWARRRQAARVKLVQLLKPAFTGPHRGVAVQALQEAQRMISLP